ncbi:MAG: CPBP family intramembrane metalloprotease [Firmicutes bacterium]|nr:CPBP family intramembrane metalloprotease [Bacillota bacterium]
MLDISKEIWKNMNVSAFKLALYKISTFMFALILLIAVSVATGKNIFEADGSEPIIAIAESVSVITGVILIMLIDKPKEWFVMKKIMSAKSFLVIIAFVLASRLIVAIVFTLVETGFNSMGYTTVPDYVKSIEAIDPFSIFYAVVAAPVCEEIIFRGFLLNRFKNYDKKFKYTAIAFLFATFHGNLAQGINAFVIGLILCYVADTYSLKWSVLVHLLNNLSSYFVGEEVALYYMLIILACFIFAVFYYIYDKNRKFKKDLAFFGGDLMTFLNVTQTQKKLARIRIRKCWLLFLFSLFLPIIIYDIFSCINSISVYVPEVAKGV